MYPPHSGQPPSFFPCFEILSRYLHSAKVSNLATSGRFEQDQCICQHVPERKRGRKMCQEVHSLPIWDPSLGSGLFYITGITQLSNTIKFRYTHIFQTCTCKHLVQELSQPKSPENILLTIPLALKSLEVNICKTNKHKKQMVPNGVFFDLSLMRRSTNAFSRSHCHR